jgi:cold shock CspA family protein
MRERGKITKWWSERGFGFADMQGSQHSGVFLHVRDFRNYTRGSPPEVRVGDKVEFTTTKDDKGLRGRDVEFIN